MVRAVQAERAMLQAAQESAAARLATRQRVLANIAESRAARQASNFEVYAAREAAAGRSVAPSRGLTFGELRSAVNAGAEAYKGSTVMGHAISKHAGRNPGIWGKITGNPSTWHEQGMQHFREVYRAPGSFQRVTDAKTGLSWIEKRLPDGRGVRLNLDGKFKGFVD